MATLLRQIALVSEVEDIDFSTLTRASAALQKQAVRDLNPIWDTAATVDVFHRLEDVPLGYWPVIVQSDIGFNAAGIHLDKDGQPFALVEFAEGWQLTASHEVLEMLVDPFGNRLVAGDSPKPDQGRVEFLVEVCDPSEAAEFGYSVNGITLSDFYTPAYFDPIKAAGVRYSFTGAIREPRQVLRGGYLSWHEPVSDHWWQLVFFGASPGFRDLGPLTQRPHESLRAMIDRISSKDSLASMTRSAGRSTALRASDRLVSAPSANKARMWRTQISALTHGTAPEDDARATGRENVSKAEASDEKGGLRRGVRGREARQPEDLEIRRPPSVGAASDD